MIITTTPQAMDLLKVARQQFTAGERGMAAHNLEVVRNYLNSIHGLKSQIEWMTVRKCEKLEKELKASR